MIATRKGSGRYNLKMEIEKQASRGARRKRQKSAMRTMRRAGHFPSKSRGITVMKGATAPLRSCRNSPQETVRPSARG